MIDPALVARVRAEVASGIDPAGLLAVYAEPGRRALLRERVRAAARVPIAEAELDAMCAELFGFGPLQQLLDDPLVTDVLVNGPREIFCERSGQLERAGVAFRGTEDVAELAHRIAASVGRELTLERPFVDARMRDGSRANAVIAPIGGPSLSIRKFNRLSIPLRGRAPSWVASGMHDDAASLLEACVRERASIVVSGATGSGKSTLLRSLAAAIPDDERLVVIEDTNELVLPHSHVVHLECVPARHGSGIGNADPKWFQAIVDSYKHAKASCLRTANGYSGNTFNEYWAGGVEWYVGNGGRDRAGLKQADPRLYDVVSRLIPENKLDRALDLLLR